jgi:LmbE family N-acetylglucosaminyl deacetylase
VINILALSPHTDDAELGAGGFLAKSVENGDNVTIVAFSTGNEETGATWQEARQASLTLGIEDSIQMDYYVDDITGKMPSFKTRRFNEARQAFLEYFIVMRDNLAPNLVLVPSTGDIHQDHQVVTAEAMRAFRKCSILGYELPWNNYSFDSMMYVELTEQQMQKKQQALVCYKSQRPRHYFDECAVNLARIRGTQIKVEFAECFEVIRWVMK